MVASVVVESCASSLSSSPPSSSCTCTDILVVVPAGKGVERIFVAVVELVSAEVGRRGVVDATVLVVAAAAVGTVDAMRVAVEVG